MEDATYDEYHPSTSTTTSTFPAKLYMLTVPPALKVATTRFGWTVPGLGLRSETTGGLPEGNTVRWVLWVGCTAVTLSTTAVAPLGTLARPATLSVKAAPPVRVSPLHWASDPESPEGSPLGGVTDAYRGDLGAEVVPSTPPRRRVPTRDVDHHVSGGQRVDRDLARGRHRDHHPVRDDPEGPRRS